jgi:glycosyltransferase involved in cell wall biosynthesis
MRHFREIAKLLFKSRGSRARFGRYLDENFYKTIYLDVAQAGLEAGEHYQQSGWREGRQPSAEFNTIWYLHTYPEAIQPGVDPLTHYVREGEKRGYKPVPDAPHSNEWMDDAERNDQLPKEIRDYLVEANILRHSGIFDPEFYVSLHPDSKSDPLQHFIRFGWVRGYNPCHLFETAWYLEKYGDVKNNKINPVVHYVKYGAHERRDPGSQFSTATYMQYNDVPADQNPLAHYLLFGGVEPVTPAKPVIVSPRKLEIRGADVQGLRRRKLARGDFKFGINFVAPVHLFNGLGTSARGYGRAFQRSGAPLSIFPWTRGFEHVSAAEVPPLPSQTYDVNIIHLNLDLISNKIIVEETFLPSLVTSSRYNIAIIYWELSSLDQQWFDTLRSFDEIWCASNFMREAVQTVFKGPVRLVRPCVEFECGAPKMTRSEFGLPSDRFTFFYSFDSCSGGGRKNPEALLEAFCEEFTEREGAFCLLKMGRSPSGAEAGKFFGALPKRADVRVIDKTYSDAEMLDLFAAIDCYVSPHRSEGLGLTIIEAMSAGKPVIATPYGGARDFVSAGSAYPIKYRLAEVGPDNLPYPASFVWADPDIGSLRAGLREIFAKEDVRKKLGAAGRRQVQLLFSLESATKAIKQEIARLQEFLQ